MSWNIESLEQKLSNVSNQLKETNETFKQTVKNISEKDESNESYEVLYELLSKEEREYHKANEAYKAFISQYSQSYAEMSDWYYGPELPYDVYCREFHKCKLNEGLTYLDSPEDIQELYQLFIFFMMYRYSIKNVHLIQ